MPVLVYVRNTTSHFSEGENCSGTWEERKALTPGSAIDQPASRAIRLTAEESLGYLAGIRCSFIAIRIVLGPRSLLSPIRALSSLFNERRHVGVSLIDESYG